jgi:hypothetical protein
VDHESADALASRLLKAYFDAPGREKARDALPDPQPKYADGQIPEQNGPGIEVRRPASRVVDRNA